MLYMPCITSIKANCNTGNMVLIIFYARWVNVWAVLTLTVFQGNCPVFVEEINTVYSGLAYYLRHFTCIYY